MFEIVIAIESIDYSSVAGKLLPIVIERMDKKSALQRIVAKFKKESVGMVKAASLVLPKGIQNDLAVRFFSVFSENSADILNNFFRDKQIDIFVQSVNIEKSSGGTAISMNIKIDKLNYESLVLNTATRIADTLERNLTLESMFPKMITLLRRIPIETFMEFLEGIPPDVKDDIIVMFLSYYESELIGLITKFAEGESIIIKIDRMSVYKLVEDTL